MTDKERFKRRRAELRREFGSLYDRVLAILFEADPAGVNFETNTDEYEPEVDTILPRLKDCRTVEDVQCVVHEEFVRWFSLETAGPVERYAGIARQIRAEVERRQLS